MRGIRQAHSVIRRACGRALLAAALTASSAGAATYYVDVNWTGPFNGTAGEPFQTLAQARAAYTNGSGHTVRVAVGEYKSTSAGGYENFGATGYDLLGKSGSWYGGYVGQADGWTTRTLPDAGGISPATMTVINLTNANARAFVWRFRVCGGISYWFGRDWEAATGWESGIMAA